ncbi:oxidoreductase [Immersiella caudata]|uniref:mRNA N(6)-methyladenine demethylase n=1 Tax=Immersiella caudata TaxID=314043 RepID=A0AA40BWQ8_9PEZI|nr:oxidoreductase [Immersiella caudata]
MTVEIKELDAHEQPSEELKAKWKSYSKTDQQELIDSGEINDLESPEKRAEFVLAGTIPAERLNTSFKAITPPGSTPVQVDKDVPIYFHPLLPGLLLVPSVVPPEVQKILLRHLVHRDLSQPHHQTNFHLHYDLPYPPDGASFFTHPPNSSIRFEPKDPSIHKPLTITQVLQRKLHWVTLGGQYDWTNRIYPGSPPPSFPPDIAAFLETLFPETLAQAAIVNFYTPGDTMMMHRDVSEETDKGLISVSIGCDSLFMIAPNDVGKMSEEGKEKMDGRGYLLLRMRSGDALYMTKESRFAWHGVPKVMRGTCPDYLEDWPAEGGQFEEWRGWMRDKRVNLNVRQMRD